MTRLAFAFALILAVSSAPSFAVSCKNGETKIRNGIWYTCFCSQNGSCMWRAD